MDAPNDASVQMTVLMWASQLGKSEVGLNIVGFFIDCDPSEILVVQPNLEDVDFWSKNRLSLMLRDSPCFHGKVRDPRSRDSGNTIRNKLFAGGDIAIVGANAPSGLAARPRRVVVMEEVDRMPASAGSEGDPCALAIRRTSRYWNAVVFENSSPTIKGLSRIERDFEETDKRYWFCPCPKCKQFQTLKWRQVLWGKRRIQSLLALSKITKEAAEDQITAASKDGVDAIYECEHCHEHLEDEERVKMVRAGEWRATSPFTGKRGFALSGINCPFKSQQSYRNRLHQMVAEFLKAERGGRLQLQTWTNTFLGESWEEKEGEEIEVKGIMARAEDYGPQALPDEILIVLAGIDVQKGAQKLTQIEVMGLGLDDETWGIETFSIQGDPESNEVWFGDGSISEALKRTYKRQDGTVISILATAIDMRYKPIRVRNFIRQGGFPAGSPGHPGLFPVYGVGHGRQGRLVTMSWHKASRLRTYALDRYQANDNIFARLGVLEPGPRYMHFPRGHGYNEEFYAQLTAEVKKPRYKYGYLEAYYEKIRDRNEALDIRGMMLGLVEPEMLNPNLIAITKWLNQSKLVMVPAQQSGVESPKPANPASQPPQRQKIRVGRW